VPAVAHLLAIALAVIPAVRGLAPLSVIPLYALLFLRSAVGLSRFRRKASAKAVGFSEIGWGLASVAWIVLAFRLA
jgi:hypothetical protein